MITFVLYIIQFILVGYMQQDVRALKSDAVQNSPKRENPNFIRDRKREFSKPEMPPSWGSRYRQLYNPAWMDYCDVYHCNDYHKQACGLNRRNMKFKWFQSICHLILNNQCSNFRGTLKYDTVETKFCHMYVMFLREGCPHLDDCSADLDPVCAMSSKDSHIVLFKNQCYMDAVNCRNSTLQEYDAVYMDFCDRRKSQSNKRQI
ncbi:uncharacterized protein LOC111361633 isoform X1 [Spodoptera litura]|uniref:Uncharacterized protein LOC111361633 isoform X1 n=2 Tax=Spodoptera litura TaxID=69820 RepID=A0A9J7IYD9_SPOLT|nr:uncharacterized protein LOC111361633 isoform X1 [Spodoptera litura]